MVHGFGLLRRAALPGVLAVSLLLGAGLATASGRHKSATLKLSGVPASVRAGSSFSVTASGYAGKFNALVFFPLTVGGCKSTYQAQADQQHGTYGVRANHNFKTVAHIYLPRYRLGGTLGSYSFCVYLYKEFSPAGPQLHKGVTYRLTS